MSNINVFTNYYEEKKERRRKELDLCMAKNSTNEFINFIPIESQERMTFNDFFRIANNYTGENDINVISNLDIYFDKTVVNYSKVEFGDFWCLARWDLKKNNEIVHCNRPDSQDVWVFRGRMNKIDAPFEMGKMGCDNRLAYLAKEAGLNVLNPSKTIKSIHVHTSNIRNYKKRNKADLIPGPYHTIMPTSLR